MMIVGRLIKLIPLNTWQILLQKPKLKIKSFLPLKSHKLTVSCWATIDLFKTKQNKTNTFLCYRFGDNCLYLLAQIPAEC